MRRVEYLDSVRGLAAFSVMIYHFIGWRWAETLSYKLGSMVFNGSDAVSLFFVLSGLVLSWKYFHPDESVKINGSHFRQFVLNRIVRLYVPFLAALALYYLYNHRADDLGLLVRQFVTNETHWVEEALLIRGKHDLYLPAWTLEVEMVVSLLVPFLTLLLRNSRVLFVSLMAVILATGTISWAVLHFGLGMLLTYYFRDIEQYDIKKARWYPYRYGIYVLIFALYSIRHITRIYPLGDVANYWLGLFRLDLFHFTGLAAGAILALVINQPQLQRLLTIRPLLFLGRISYSLYLLHWLFVIFVMDRWDYLASLIGGERRVYWILLAFVVVGTLVASTIFNILVERPAIRLGKKVADRFAPKPTYQKAV
ncbi:acyltransferase family protein [Hymenobacter latericus]|uniref:acyltransferase family protein n=1 Tax=Hymenobacter sp. YIM 151858-1 TaxID=2987688 RepID=UPI002227C8FD|nr:acyltransferase [Hymenobacter sp. YIM 151858-1]UYZ59646.1 acyltransferase [Hymenobacter sp. YIM 151858-1]